MIIQDISRGAGKYEIVYTDPPWEQAKGGEESRSTEFKRKTP